MVSQPLNIELDRLLNDLCGRCVALAGGLLLIQALLSLGQRLAAALARAKPLRQLIPASVTVKLVLLAINPLRLLEDLGDDPRDRSGSDRATRSP